MRFVVYRDCRRRDAVELTTNHNSLSTKYKIEIEIRLHKIKSLYHSPHLLEMWHIRNVFEPKLKGMMERENHIKIKFLFKSFSVHNSK